MFIRMPDTKLIVHRSALYNLKPYNVGEDDVECATSYISRLAFEHSVSFRMLINRIILPSLNDDQRGGKLFKKTMSQHSFHLNGINFRATILIRKLNELTGRTDLQLLTFLPWKSKIYFRRLVREDLSYCPMCLKQQWDQNMDLYFPLLWCVNSVAVCPKHCIYLEKGCPYCGARILAVSADSHPGFCGNCQHTILKSSTDIRTAERSSKDYWISTHFSKLISSNKNPYALLTYSPQLKKMVFPMFLNSTWKDISSLSIRLDVPTLEAAVSSHAIPFGRILEQGYPARLSPLELVKPSKSERNNDKY